MYVIGHNHITHQQKLVPFANRSQRAHKQVSRANRSQQRQPSVTTEGHEVQIAAAVIAFQILGHERPPKSPRVTPTRGAPIYDGVGSVKGHEESASRGARILFT